MSSAHSHPAGPGKEVAQPRLLRGEQRSITRRFIRLRCREYARMHHLRCSSAHASVSSIGSIVVSPGARERQTDTTITLALPAYHPLPEVLAFENSNTVRAVHRRCHDQRRYCSLGLLLSTHRSTVYLHAPSTKRPFYCVPAHSPSFSIPTGTTIDTNAPSTVRRGLLAWMNNCRKSKSNSKSSAHPPSPSLLPEPRDFASSTRAG